MKIALETLNKIVVRLQKKEPVTDIENDMLLGLLIAFIAIINKKRIFLCLMS